jgi:hypothetical protein
MAPTHYAHGQCTTYFKTGLSNPTANLNWYFYSYVIDFLLYKSSTLYFTMLTWRTQSWLHSLGPYELSHITKATGGNSVTLSDHSSDKWVNYELFSQLPHKRKITYTSVWENRNGKCSCSTVSTIKHPQSAHNAVWPIAGVHRSWMPGHHGN